MKLLIVGVNVKEERELHTIADLMKLSDEFQMDIALRRPEEWMGTRYSWYIRLVDDYDCLAEHGVGPALGPVAGE